MKRSELAALASSNKRWLVIGSLTVAAILFVLALPYATSAYHLEAGGQALSEALGTTDALTWWYVGPRETLDSQALQEAIAHLEKAHRNAHGQRLLGQAYAAQGDLPKSIQALERFTESRPDHRLGHLELAAAYDLADRHLQDLVYADLMANLPGTRISAPDLDGQVLYQPEGWNSEYVYPTTFGLPPNYGDRPTLFVHAGSQVTWTVPLTQPSVLRFGMGLDPRAIDWGSDGATFEVFVNRERVFLEHLPAELAQEGWQEREVDLAAHTGQSVRLALATTPGPVGVVTGDWAGWGEPRLEASEADTYRQVVSGKPWLATWKELGTTVSDFIQAGETARKAQQYEEALSWYQWADRLSPGRGDPWYYTGLVNEEQEQWPQALAAYEQAIEFGHFREVPRSSPYYRSGAIYQRQLESRQLNAALAAYRTAIETNEFGSTWEKADCHHKWAETLRWQGVDPDQYIAGFQQAIEIYPGHSGAHMLLGVSIYELDQDPGRAEAELLKALELAPRNKWVYYHLGELYRQEGQTEKAEAMYSRALEVDPGFALAQQQRNLIQNPPSKSDKQDK